MPNTEVLNIAVPSLAARNLQGFGGANTPKPNRPRGRIF